MSFGHKQVKHIHFCCSIVIILVLFNDTLTNFFHNFKGNSCSSYLVTVAMEALD